MKKFGVENPHEKKHASSYTNQEVIPNLELINPTKLIKPL